MQKRRLLRRSERGEKSLHRLGQFLLRRTRGRCLHRRRLRFRCGKLRRLGRSVLRRKHLYRWQCRLRRRRWLRELCPLLCFRRALLRDCGKPDLHSLRYDLQRKQRRVYLHCLRRHWPTLLRDHEKRHLRGRRRLQCNWGWSAHVRSLRNRGRCLLSGQFLHRRGLLHRQRRQQDLHGSRHRVSERQRGLPRRGLCR